MHVYIYIYICYYISHTLSHIFPWNTGGAPISKAVYTDAEHKKLICLESRNVNCVTWYQTKEATDEVAYGLCECASYNDTGTNEFCDIWHCNDVEIDNCDPTMDEYDCGTYTVIDYIGYYESCCVDSCVCDASKSELLPYSKIII
jgi:hypothetical protein